MSVGGPHRIAFTDWGQPIGSGVPVICVPGLTRQGRDFDFLAAELARCGRRVLCPDLPGRGRSGRLLSPLQYILPQHCADVTAVCLATGAEAIDWVGTSVGGLIGMVLAGLPGSRIRRLVINDIGPTVPVAAEARIGEKLVDMPKAFKTFDEAVAFYCSAFPDYGELDDTCWRHIARHSIEWSETEQKFRLLFDRGIIWAYHFYRYYSMPLWPFWRNIKIPVLILAGEKSDFLPLSLAVEMQRQNPRARIVENSSVGHTPMLMQSDQIDPVVQFLLEV